VEAAANRFELHMNHLKYFFITLSVLTVLTTLPFLLVPDLMNSLDQLGIRIPSFALLSILLILLSMPRKQARK